MKVVDQYKPREYSAISHDAGVVLCDKESGAFLVLRFHEDLERLKVLLGTLQVLPILSRADRIAQLEAERDALMAEDARA
jgi:hypothetical protein